MRRGAVESDTLTNWGVALIVLLAIGGIVLYFSGTLRGVNVVNVPLTSIVAKCNFAADTDAGKAEYCTLNTNTATQIDGIVRYVDCTYLAGKNLLESSSPIFGTCPNVQDREKVFCQSLVTQKSLKRDSYVNDKLCVGDETSWLGVSYDVATKKA